MFDWLIDLNESNELAPHKMAISFYFSSVTLWRKQESLLFDNDFGNVFSPVGTLTFGP